MFCHTEDRNKKKGAAHVENYNVLGNCLRRMYQVQVAIIISLLLAFVPLINFFVIVVALGAVIVNVAMLLKLRSLHPDYQNAFLAFLVGIPLILLGNGEGAFAEAMGIGGSIASLMQTYFIIRGTDSFLEELGRDEVITKGKIAWRLMVLNSGISIVTGFMALSGIGEMILIAVASLLVGIVSCVFYMQYLKQGSEAFGVE